MASELDFGDWVIEFVTYKDKTTLVYPPGQLLLIDHYNRQPNTRKERWVFHLEAPQNGQAMIWKEFAKATKSFLAQGVPSKPCTKPIRNVPVADRLLGLWTGSGRISQRRTARRSILS